nr:transposase domain-containing protein [Sphingobium limneticum]
MPNQASAWKEAGGLGAAATQCAEAEGIDQDYCDSVKKILNTFFTYITDLLNRIHDHKINRIGELLPWNWVPRTVPQALAA